jgi:hypothetical protein
MKKIFPAMLSFLFGMSILSSSCKKEAGSDVIGPDITYATSGFLCTIGIGRNYVIDTLVVHPTNGFEAVREYGYGFTPSKDELNITNNSNGTVSLKLTTPDVSSTGTYTHIGLYGSNLPLGSATFYPIQFTKQATFETDLLIKRNAADGKKFSLESKAVRGYYLSAIHPGVQYQPNSTTETKLVFSTKKQEFFFLSK